MNRIALIGGMLVLAASTALAQEMDHAAMSRVAAAESARDTAPPAEPREPGQSAYAALGETVRILLADPKTDWSAVDVDALRAHLVDMDNVTMRAEVTKTRLANGALFHVAGEGSVVGSIQRMIKTHFAQPDFGKAWTMTVQPTATGADVTVLSADAADAVQIYQLGFFGILTLGAHHPPHHLMMARGMMHH